MILMFPARIIFTEPHKLLAKSLRDSGVDVILADSDWRRLKPAREAGMETFFGEVLSEDAEMRLDHTRFESVVALSANEPYNALVCGQFAPELGQHRVFQLSAQDGEDEDPRAIGVAARGRTLIKRGRSYDALIRDHYRGWEFAVVISFGPQTTTEVGHRAAEASASISEQKPE